MAFVYVCARVEETKRKRYTLTQSASAGRPSRLFKFLDVDRSGSIEYLELSQGLFRLRKAACPGQWKQMGTGEREGEEEEEDFLSFGGGGMREKGISVQADVDVSDP